MVNKPLIRPYFLGGVALGGVARIPMIISLAGWATEWSHCSKQPLKKHHDLFRNEVS